MEYEIHTGVIPAHPPAGGLVTKTFSASHLKQFFELR